MAKISWARSFKASGIYRRLWPYGEIHKSKPVKVLTHRGAREAFLFQHYRKYLNNLSNKVYIPVWHHAAVRIAKRIKPITITAPSTGAQLLWHPYRIYLHNLTR